MGVSGLNCPLFPRFPVMGSQESTYHPGVCEYHFHPSRLAMRGLSSICLMFAWLIDSLTALPLTHSSTRSWEVFALQRRSDSLRCCSSCRFGSVKIRAIACVSRQPQH